MHKLFRALMALVLSMFLVAPADASARPRARHELNSAQYSVSRLYSSRARRRARTILQLKLLELHRAHLDRLRAVILRKLPLDELLKAAKSPG